MQAFVEMGSENDFIPLLENIFDFITIIVDYTPYFVTFFINYYLDFITFITYIYPDFIYMSNFDTKL